MSPLLTRLLEEHGKLRSLSDDVRSLVATQEPCNLEKLAQKRWELASMVHRHLVFEERQVFQRLLDDPRSEARMMSARCRQAIEELHSAYKFHVDAWSASTVMDSWPKFRVAVDTLVEQMMVRIGFEERHLFPFLGKDPILLPTRYPVARNWAGDAVALAGAIKLETSQSLPGAVNGARSAQTRETPCPASVR